MYFSLCEMYSKILAMTYPGAYSQSERVNTFNSFQMRIHLPLVLANHFLLLLGISCKVGCFLGSEWKRESGREREGEGGRGSTLKCNTGNFWLQFSTSFFCRLRFDHKSVVHIAFWATAQTFGAKTFVGVARRVQCFLRLS